MWLPQMNSWEVNIPAWGGYSRKELQNKIDRLAMARAQRPKLALWEQNNNFIDDPVRFPVRHAWTPINDQNFQVPSVHVPTRNRTPKGIVQLGW